MAERPLSKQNWHQRSINSFGPKFRIDLNNPTMGLNGTDVYNFYAVTDNKDVCIASLSEGGTYKIYNDQSIEIVAGQKAKSTGVDIMICGKNGDVTITAEKNGTVKIRASEIILDADENITFKCGKDIVVDAGGRFLVQAQQADCEALTGNMAPKGSSFGEICFKDTFVDQKLIEDTFFGGILKVFSSILK